MLPVINQSEEQTRQEQTTRESLHKSITDTLRNDKVQASILNDLGLSPKTEETEKTEERKPLKKEVKEETEEESQEESFEEIEEEDNQDDSKEEDQEDEEVIPKSKIQPRIDKLTAQIKAQQKELEELKASRHTESKDDVTKQLEAMTPEQLRAAKLEVRKAQIKAQNDDSQLNELLALEDKIDNVISEAPKNFQKSQADAYSKKAQQIAESGDIPNLEKVAPQIIKIANEIYAEYPSLHKDVNGQAIALDLAAKHYKLTLNSVGGDKSKETELKRQNNNLKRKITLDTKTGKVNADKTKLDSMRRSAIGGTLEQKVSLVKSHPMFNVDKMIPDEFKS
jgi:hypothetical protein